MYVMELKYSKEVEESVRKLMKGLLIATGALAILALAVPAAAAETAKGTCTAQVGSNTVSYDCNYVANDYEMGAPLTLHLDYACSVRCGGVLAFGLSGPGYTPKGDVSGHIMSVDRSAGAMDFTLMFDKLHEDSGGQGHCNGTAFMSIMLNVDDGTGRFRPTSLPFKVHVNSNGGSAGSN
jgi:hypothetical protein